MIELKDITRVYKRGNTNVFALQNVSLQIKKGEFLAIVGPSGSGKSTLLHIIGCLDRPSSGKYFLNNDDVSEKSDRELSNVRNKKIGFIFQMFNLLPRIDCIKNVELPLFYAQVKNKEAKERAISLLKKVGLSDRLFHKPSELSGGEMQRVAIARALINNPGVICADEPTGNLDTKTGNQIIKLIKEINEGGITIILITHNLEIANVADRIIRLRDGRIENEDF